MTAVAELFVDECERAQPRVAIPVPEMRLVVRFGPSVRDGLDIHVLGVRDKVHRKLVPGGLRVLFARLPLNTYQAVLGVPALDIAGRVVALGDVWGDTATQRLSDRLAGTRDMAAATATLESVIAERIARADKPSAHAELAFNAAGKLGNASITAVARDLGVSERQFRRVFREEAGMSPKTFAKLARFRRALNAASGKGETSWADIAAAVGYYDQAHLIAEFRAIAGTTPRVLLAELHGQAA